MPSTINFLSDVSSLARFSSDGLTVQTPKYLNNDGSPRHSWTASGGTVAVTLENIKLPSCNSLQISPTSTGLVRVQLGNIFLPGTVTSSRDIIRYLFHGLLYASREVQVFVKLESDFGTAISREARIPINQFASIRSNTITLDPTNNQPSASYLGSDIVGTITIEIADHGGLPMFLTFPSLIDADGWRFNSVMRGAAGYIPTFYLDVDEIQDPEYPFFKLIDALSYAAGDAMSTYASWFPLDLSEIPVGATKDEAWTKSSLTDKSIIDSENVPWLGNVIGSPIYGDIYAVDPITSSTRGWQGDSYPLDMTNLIYVDLLSSRNVPLNDLIVIPKWLPVRTASTANVDISSALIDGQSIGGVVVATGDRVLLKHQSNQAQNGIYVVVASGAASRSTDANTSAEFSYGKSVKVTDGQYAGTYWGVTLPPSFILDTNAISVSEVSRPGVVDGVDLADNMTVLVINQVNPTENGVYLVNNTGRPTRYESLANPSAFTSGVYCEIESGDQFSGTLWSLDVDKSVTYNAPSSSIRTNYAENPSFHASTSSYIGVDSTISITTDDSYVGEHALKVVPLSLDEEVAVTLNPAIVAVEGETWTASVYVKNINGESREHRLYLKFLDVSDVLLQETYSSVVLDYNSPWVRLSITGIAPLDTAKMNIAVEIQENNQSLTNESIIDAVLIEKSDTVGNYFDGLHYIAGGIYTLANIGWTGTAHASVSTCKEYATSVPLVFSPVDRLADFRRSQTATAMYGHAAGSVGSIRDTTRRLLRGNRQVAIAANSPDAFYITVKTLLDETPGVTEVISWTGCRVATDSDVNLSTELDDGSVVDGVTIVTGDRILVKSQSNQDENGIYVAQALGAAVRATDADAVGEFIVGKTVYVEAGSLQGNSYYALSTAPTVLGSTPIVFAIADTLGSSDAIIRALEPTRPLGFEYIHQTVNKFGFTFNSATLGRVGQGSLR